MDQSILRLADEPSPWHLDVLLVEPAGEHASDGSVVSLLEGVGHRVRVARDGREAIAFARAHAPDILIVDMETPGTDAFLLLNQVRALHPDMHVVLASAAPCIDEAVAATKSRADYLVGPLTLRNLLGPVAAVARKREIQLELFQSRVGGDPLVGKSPLIKALKRDARIIAQADGHVLIAGEPGTGKQVVARMIHAASTRADRRLVEVDCAAAAPNQVCETILGAGGALSDAAGGTLVLDHIEALSRVAQAKLIQRLETRAIDVRIIAVTGEDAGELERQGVLSAELASRLRQHQLEVAPLRQRRDDLPMLVEFFCCKYAGSDGGSARVSPEVWAVLASARFPGNVRQLELSIKHAVAFSDDGELRLEHLPADLRSSSGV